MVLVKNGAVADDPWVFVGDGEDLPEAGPALVSFERWQRDRAALAARTAPHGVRLTSEARAEALEGAVGALALIALDFPAFTDGRPYSTARLLRERYGYTGELRATGQVLRDQAQFLLRCGFDSFELPDGAEAAGWEEALSEIGIVYQPAADARAAAGALRRR